ncbi:DUF72 domain-containing protein [Lutibaculum baratangense]|nr:DUF72 domain-containing protein [Lutibaculum baratangense]
MAAVRIGTSGWHYDGWIGTFYPEKTPKKRLLEAYARHFSTTEINASFYRVPSEAAVASWAANAPDGFVFAWKASRFITHYKRLKDCEEPVRYVTGRMAPLGEKFGPVLWQLPPQQKPDHDRLGRFLDLLPKERRHAVEFRDPAWYEEATFRLLRDAGVSLCVSDHAHAPAPWEATAAHVYLRPHGPGGRYEGHYSNDGLADMADRIAGWTAESRDVFCYFDNDQKSCAPFDAQRLIGMVRERGVEVA